MSTNDTFTFVPLIPLMALFPNLHADWLYVDEFGDVVSTYRSKPQYLSGSMYTGERTYSIGKSHISASDIIKQLNKYKADYPRAFADAPLRHVLVKKGDSKQKSAINWRPSETNPVSEAIKRRVGAGNPVADVFSTPQAALQKAVPHPAPAPASGPAQLKGYVVGQIYTDAQGTFAIRLVSSAVYSDQEAAELIKKLAGQNVGWHYVSLKIANIAAATQVTEVKVT